MLIETDLWVLEYLDLDGEAFDPRRFETFYKRPHPHLRKQRDTQEFVEQDAEDGKLSRVVGPVKIEVPDETPEEGQDDD